MSSEMYTDTSLYDINAHLQYLYLYSGHSTGNRTKTFLVGMSMRGSWQVDFDHERSS